MEPRSIFRSSVVDPNTSTLDPDTEFLPNFDLDPGLYYTLWEEKNSKIILEKSISGFFLKKSVFKAIKQKNFLVSLVSELWIYILILLFLPLFYDLSDIYI